MLKKLQKSNSEGFTIIEVMIVLAIAAIILLIVLLAVPALQRNSRNTQRKNDVSALISGVNESITNNNGQLPTGCTGTNPVTWTGGSGTPANTVPGYYNQGCAGSANGPGTGASGNVYLETNPTGFPKSTSTTATQDWVYIIEGATCNAAGTQATSGGSRSFAALYQIETGSGTFASVCTAS